MATYTRQAPTGETNAPELRATVITVTVLSFFFMSMRLFCKARYAKVFGLDDALLVLSWACLLAFTILECLSTNYGLGMHTAEVNSDLKPRMNIYLYVGQFFVIIGIAISKTSFGVTLLRLAIYKWHKALLWFCLVTVNLVLWPCAIEFFVSCTPIEKKWDLRLPGSCWPVDVLVKTAVFAGVWSAVTDFALAAFPWLLFRELQMRHVEKLGVSICMSMGVLSGIFAIIKSAQLPATLGDFAYKSTPLIIWSGAELAVIIMASSIPFIRLFWKEVYEKTAKSLSKPGGSAARYNVDKSKSNMHMPSSHNRTHVTADQVFMSHDDSSDSTILGMPSKKRGILRTDEITVERRVKSPEVDLELQSVP